MVTSSCHCCHDHNHVCGKSCFCHLFSTQGRCPCCPGLVTSLQLPVLLVACVPQIGNHYTKYPQAWGTPVIPINVLRGDTLLNRSVVATQPILCYILHAPILISMDKKENQDGLHFYLRCYMIVFANYQVSFFATWNPSRIRLYLFVVHNTSRLLDFAKNGLSFKIPQDISIHSFMSNLFYTMFMRMPPQIKVFI